MKMRGCVLAAVLAFTTLSAHAQWVGGAHTVENSSWGQSTSDRPSQPAPRSRSCAELQRRAAHDLKNAAAQGDPRNYSFRLAALAPMYRVNCD
ncbi:exported hypothetical protein [Paraburkholderia sacchari]